MTLGHPNAFARQFDFWNSHLPGTGISAPWP
jgi:hypothetical protein